MYEHLLVALDGSDTAERVLPHVEALAASFGSTVTLLQAVVSAETLIAETSSGGTGVGDAASSIDPTPIVDADRESASAYLAKVEARLRQNGISVNSEHPEGTAQDVIVERAKSLGTDLIMMTTHGRSGLGRMFFGSVADSVLRHASCPVLIVRVTEA